MLNINTNDEYSKIFIEDDYSFDKIRKDVVVDVQSESDVINALNVGVDGELNNKGLSSLLSEGPEIMQINILGLKIDVAILENLLNYDILNPEWEVMFKMKDAKSELNYIGKVYNSNIDGKEKFSYNLILSKIAEVIKNIVELQQVE